jgi:hypothetical protein
MPPTVRMAAAPTPAKMDNKPRPRPQTPRGGKTTTKGKKSKPKSPTANRKSQVAPFDVMDSSDDLPTGTVGTDDLPTGTVAAYEQADTDQLEAGIDMHCGIDMPPDVAGLFAELLAGSPRGKALPAASTASRVVHTPRGGLATIDDSVGGCASGCASGAPSYRPPSGPQAACTGLGALLDELKRKKSAIATATHRRGTAAEAGDEVTSSLKRAPTTNGSRAQVESGVSIRPDTRPELFAEVRRGFVILKHVDERAIRDRSAPLLERECHIERSKRPALFDELRKRFSTRRRSD